jgi:hypothetical protein
LKFNKLFFIFSLTFVLLINTNIIFAQDVNSSDVNELIDSLDQVSDDDYDFDYIINNTLEAKNLFNDNFNKVPEAVKKLFGNEKILFIIEDVDTNVTTNLSANFKKGLIENLTLDDFEKYTLEIRLYKNNVNSIFSSKDPVSYLKKAIADKDITYKGKGFVGSIKFFFVKLFSGFFY